MLNPTMHSDTLKAFEVSPVKVAFTCGFLFI